MKLTVPELSLVVMIGVSGSGKSSFARRHFLPTEILSSDFCRGLVSDDETDQTATDDAFELLHYVASKRLARGKLTVIDATNVQTEARKPLVQLARQYHCLPVAIVLDLPEKLCRERNRARPDRDFGSHVTRGQARNLKRSIKGLKREGFRRIHILDSPDKIEAAEIVREPLWNDKKEEKGPFDIIGDVHGCLDELIVLLRKLGYKVGGRDGEEGWEVSHPEGRKAVFLGDLADRGPDVPGAFRLAMDMVESGKAYAVPGNHDVKLLKYLDGKNVQVRHGLLESIEGLEKESEEFRRRVGEFIRGLISHYVFDGGGLVVAHAGMKEELQGRGSGQVREFALFGETTGETDEFGLPVRYDWASEYRGKAMVAYGHTPVPEPEWLNGTINLDTGCVFGGRLTALRYPERELVWVEAARQYHEPVKPLERGAPDFTAQQEHDDALDIDDVLGKRLIETRLRRGVTVKEENSIAALEAMTRFAIDPKWLIYLPPTMSPTETSTEPGLLEHPAQALDYFRKHNVSRVVCEEKHMGSRCVAIACRNEKAARERFGVRDDETGALYTRTGRRFFDNDEVEREFLARVRNAAGAAGVWEKLETDWICLDCELMPWSAKAQELLRSQYAAVGSASRAALAQAINALGQAKKSGTDVHDLLSKYTNKSHMADGFVEAYRHYCWNVESISDLKLAPFHVMASEGAVHADKDHLWHMETIAGICDKDEEILLATDFKTVEPGDEKSEAEGTRWWEELTGKGGEGMVIKPLDFVARGERGLIQPAIKCRGREYLRIIYGQEYTLPENLERLKKRGLSTKRSLALREFALGLEALERFVRKEPLRRVHECAFGVLALESEPVDPRL